MKKNIWHRWDRKRRGGISPLFSSFSLFVFHLVSVLFWLGLSEGQRKNNKSKAGFWGCVFIQRDMRRQFTGFQVPYRCRCAGVMRCSVVRCGVWGWWCWCCCWWWYHAPGVRIRIPSVRGPSYGPATTWSVPRFLLSVWMYLLGETSEEPAVSGWVWLRGL